MLVKPIITAAEAAAKVQEGDVLMSGGFMGCGAAHTLIRALKTRGM